MNANWPIDERSIILPVPMHPLKKRLRGFAAAEELALGLHEKTGLDLMRAVRPTGWIRSQTRRTRSQRQNRPKNMFSADSLPQRYNQVILVDDVMTTGATANACSAAIKRNRPVTVRVLTAARTPKAQ